ncbi:unnamed protein product [Ilex paraguariensis]|uniref:Trichome birefringence-like N-terminal domain-containing protein n=1 Tax=Ilex paraguariensis TaxID=185542 RepID=A0ABC8RF52_9AQUA
MGTTYSQKNRYTLSTIILLALFLLSLFFFSKRALEPKLSLYRDDFSGTPLFSSPLPPPTRSDSLQNSSNSFTITDSNPDHNALNSSIQIPIWPNPDFNVSSTEIELADSGVEEKKDNLTISDHGDSNVSRKRLKWEEGCDLYAGNWVKDEEYPMYKPGSCPYVDDGFDCQSNGRRDSEYLKWRWKPDGCDLPRTSYEFAFWPMVDEERNQILLLSLLDINIDSKLASDFQTESRDLGIRVS